LSAATLCCDILSFFGVNSDVADDFVFLCVAENGIDVKADSFSFKKKESEDVAIPSPSSSSSRKMMFWRSLFVLGREHRSVFCGVFGSSLGPRTVLRLPTEELSVTLTVLLEDVDEVPATDAERDVCEKIRAGCLEVMEEDGIVRNCLSTDGDEVEEGGAVVVVVVVVDADAECDRRLTI